MCFLRDSKFPFPKGCESWLKMVIALRGNMKLVLEGGQRLKSFTVGNVFKEIQTQKVGSTPEFAIANWQGCYVLIC